LLNFIGKNDYPLEINDLEGNVYVVENDDKLFEIVYDLMIKYQNYKDFNLADFLTYLNIKLNFDLRTMDLIRYIDFNKTNPIPIERMPCILFEAITLINSLRE